MNVAIRQEIKELIDDLGEQNLCALKPLLTLLANNESPVIETDLTDEERGIIAKRMKDYDCDPSSFVSLESILEERPLN